MMTTRDVDDDDEDYCALQVSQHFLMIAKPDIHTQTHEMWAANAWSVFGFCTLRSRAALPVVCLFSKDSIFCICRVKWETEPILCGSQTTATPHHTQSLLNMCAYINTLHLASSDPRSSVCEMHFCWWWLSVKQRELVCVNYIFAISIKAVATAGL